MKRIGLLLAISMIVSCADPVIRHSPQTVARKSDPPPARVERLTATTATMSWNPNPASEQITSYGVYEVLPKTPTLPPRWGRIGTVTGTQFGLSALIPGTVHIYGVTAMNAVEGPMSGAVYRVR